MTETAGNNAASRPRSVAALHLIFLASHLHLTIPVSISRSSHLSVHSFSTRSTRRRQPRHPATGGSDLAGPLRNIMNCAHALAPFFPYSRVLQKSLRHPSHASCAPSDRGEAGAHHGLGWRTAVMPVVSSSLLMPAVARSPAFALPPSMHEPSADKDDCTLLWSFTAPHGNQLPPSSKHHHIEPSHCSQSRNGASPASAVERTSSSSHPLPTSGLSRTAGPTSRGLCTPLVSPWSQQWEYSDLHRQPESAPPSGCSSASSHWEGADAQSTPLMSATNASWSPSSPLLHKTTVPLTPDTYQLVQRCVYALEDVVRANGGAAPLSTLGVPLYRRNAAFADLIQRCNGLGAFIAAHAAHRLQLHRDAATGCALVLAVQDRSHTPSSAAAHASPVERCAAALQRIVASQEQRHMLMADAGNALYAEDASFRRVVCESQGLSRFVTLHASHTLSVKHIHGRRFLCLAKKSPQQRTLREDCSAALLAIVRAHEGPAMALPQVSTALYKKDGSFRSLVSYHGGLASFIAAFHSHTLSTYTLRGLEYVSLAGVSPPAGSRRVHDCKPQATSLYHCVTTLERLVRDSLSHSLTLSTAGSVLYRALPGSQAMVAQRGGLRHFVEHHASGVLCLAPSGNVLQLASSPQEACAATERAAACVAALEDLVMERPMALVRVGSRLYQKDPRFRELVSTSRGLLRFVEKQAPSLCVRTINGERCLARIDQRCGGAEAGPGAQGPPQWAPPPAPFVGKAPADDACCKAMAGSGQHAAPDGSHSGQPCFRQQPHQPERTEDAAEAGEAPTASIKGASQGAAAAAQSKECIGLLAALTADGAVSLTDAASQLRREHPAALQHITACGGLRGFVRDSGAGHVVLQRRADGSLSLSAAGGTGSEARWE